MILGRLPSLDCAIASAVFFPRKQSCYSAAVLGNKAQKTEKI